MPATERNAQQKLLIRIAKPTLAFAVFVVCLLLSEVVVRLVGAAPEFKSIEFIQDDCVYKRSTNPILGFELKSNYRNPSPDFIATYERTNQHGQRDQPRQLSKKTGVRRILLLGDSVVEGYGLPENETISNHLQNELGDSYEVLNFGVSAYCTLAEVELLRVKGVNFKPDVVILVFVENDFDNFNREAFPLQGTIERSAWIQGMFERSDLFRLACVKWNLFHFGLESDPIGWHQKAIGDNNVSQGIELLSQLAKQHEFQPCIAIWPRFQSDQIVDIGFVDEGTDLLIVEHLAARQQIPTVRLSDSFRKQLAIQAKAASNPRLQFSSGDELHPSATGSRLAAAFLKQAVADLEAGRLSPMQLPENSPAVEQTVDKAKTYSSAQPNYARVFNRLGNQLIRDGKPTEAIVQFEKAIASDPNHAGSHNNLGIALERIDRRDEAIQAYKRAISLNPNFTEANFNLARSFLKQEKNKIAIAGLKKTIQCDPKHVLALTLLGRELGKQRKFEDAKRYLLRAVAIDSGHAEGHNNLGVVYAALGDRPSAIRHFRQAIVIDSQNRFARANLKALGASAVE